MRIIHSVDNIFGGKTYYDETGMIGQSVVNLFGGETIYDMNGNIAARSVENIFGGETVYAYDDEPFTPTPRHDSSSWVDDFDFDSDYEN